MRLATAREFEQTLLAGGLVMSDPNRGIGRELRYPETPERTVVVQFSTTDPIAHRRGIAQRVLDVTDRWFLVPRHGALPSFGLVDVNDESMAVAFECDERGALAEYLPTRPMSFAALGR